MDPSSFRKVPVWIGLFWLWTCPFVNWILLIKDRFHCDVDYSGSGQVPVSDGFFWLMWIPLALHRYQCTMDPAGFRRVPVWNTSDSAVSDTEYSGLEYLSLWAIHMDRDGFHIGLDPSGSETGLCDLMKSWWILDQFSIWQALWKNMLYGITVSQALRIGSFSWCCSVELVLSLQGTTFQL
jgi:hypothetical protein